ncbi:MAG: hypothetical protein FWH04_10120 [Oscillospiraceae bacterium]|nr:hypothetical protein [Oscillospiraceae bacterium]
MLSQEQMSKLKRVSVSVDPEKTRVRMKADFSAATKKKKAAIIELSGQNRGTLYRVYRTGTATARMILAMSQHLNVWPYYYTGEYDEKKPCEDAYLLKFLQDHGYENIVKEIVSGKESGNTIAKTSKSISAPAAGTAKEPRSGVLPPIDQFSPEMRVAIDALTLEDAVLLLQAILKRAASGGEVAENADMVKYLLLK